MVVALAHARHPPHTLLHLSETVFLTTAPSSDLLPLHHLARLENFGHSLRSSAYLYQPNSVDDLDQLFELSRQQDLTVGLRGSGRSYGDASLNSGQIVLDMRPLNNILAWDPQSGVITVEPGVTIEQLWMHTLGDGWWPPVVPGTMRPTLGGCLAANIHGKNNWVAGTIGEHVIEFDALLPSGETLTCSPEKNADIFHAMIGGMGLLGVFTSITLQMKQIHSGQLRVMAWAKASLAGMLESVDGNKTADYVVGWVDCTSGSGRMGRGQIHRAEYLKPGEDPDPTNSLRIDQQILQDRIFGLLPKSILHKLMQPFTNNIGTLFINSAKYWASRTVGQNTNFLQTMGAFNFLLDYVPNWERAYGPMGLIQYQSFLPKASAEAAYSEMLNLCHNRHLPAYLGVLKRHRPDPFLLSHALDGFSLALDFRVTQSNRASLLNLIAELDEIALAAGGRFYFAKDSTLNAEKAQRFLGEDVTKQFRALKSKADPNNRLQTDLYRRCFAE
jgi:FAD/FMN-containing dehydrogenase